MKRAIFKSHGDPAKMIEILEEKDPVPGPGEVRVRNLVMTINPADLLAIQGQYGAQPMTLPATPGVGAYGVVDAIGHGVSQLKVGDAVLPVGSGLWADAVILKERMAPKAPAGCDPEQAALMRANPATAYLMLTDMVKLEAGDWIVQNAANSNVGRMVIRFAHELGLKTVNIVRRGDVAEALRSDGADIVIIDEGQDMAAAISSATSAMPKLALDAVGGSATKALGAAVMDRGTVVVYGLLSGETNQLNPRDLVFRDVKLRGFWLFDWYRTANRQKMHDLHSFLEAKLAKGILQTDIEARYPLDHVREAVAHAARDGRNGKILLKGNNDA